MNLILCLDDKNGFLFNRRRLSRDVELCRKCLELKGTANLWVDGYSAKLFQELTGDVRISENMFSDARADDYCFTEATLPDMELVERLFVFRWNRLYPADVRFCPADVGFSCIFREDFPGKSHKVITLEVYAR